MAALAIYLPYMIFAGLIGIMGILLIPELGTSDSIIPAMIDKTTGDLTGAFLLSGLLAAVMGTAASVAMATSITFTRDVVKRIKKDMDGKQVLLTQRASLVVFTILAIIVGYQGSSIVTIMEDVGAPCVAALIPIFLEKDQPKRGGDHHRSGCYFHDRILAHGFSSWNQPFPGRINMFSCLPVC